MIKKVGIFGDSWPTTSFKKLPNFQEIPDDLNFQKLFADIGIKCENHALGGGTNLDTLAKINEHAKEYDLLIVFQTDPIRQCLDKSANLLENLEIPQADSFQGLCEKLLEEFYIELGKQKTPILLIGGCTTLCHTKVPAHIKTLPYSWTELLSPGFVDNYCYWIEQTALLYDFAKKKNNWSTEEFFEIEKSIKSKNFIWQTSECFSWCHASKIGYEKMFTEIKRMIDATS